MLDYLGSDPEIRTLQLSRIVVLLQHLTDDFLVLVDEGSVDVAIASVQSRSQGHLQLVRVVGLEI